MTDRITRTKPAAVAKVVVTGASLTSVLAMTAAMGSAASPDPAEPTLVTKPDSVTTVAPLDVTGSSFVPPPNLFEQPTPVAPVVGQVVPNPTPSVVAVTTVVSEGLPSATAPISASPNVPAAAPTPIIVNVPTPAPAPSASTRTSR